MAFSASVDRKKGTLVIGQGHFLHNHEMSHDIYQAYPENRNEAVIAEAKKWHSLSVPTHVFQEKLKELSGKNITQRDIYNLRASLTLEQRGENRAQQMLDAMEEVMRGDPGCEFKILSKENGEISVVFMQVSMMRSALEKFPEVILCDATYKVNENKMPLLSFLVEDGNGKSVPCAHAFVENEMKETLSNVFTILKGCMREKSN